MNIQDAALIANGVECAKCGLCGDATLVEAGNDYRGPIRCTRCEKEQREDDRYNQQLSDINEAREELENDER